MTRILCLLLLSTIALLADVTGKWSGTFDITGPDGSIKSTTAVLNLKQDGNNLSGTAGPNDDQQMTIRAGKVDGSRITFEVAQDDGAAIKFDLLLAEEHIKGTASGEHDGEKMSAKLDVTRK
ncbi:MAG TPA: hypothetical protein VGV35_09990 [Bryobacteraceae bacterium]|nr:hypothetical protein [Bryobacteraceae bacterium]